MNDIASHQFQTGRDPRTLPAYASLCDEMGKLTHPARPDVNWHYAEKLCLTLFAQNGVELQTAAWYTLTRTQLAGLPGLNEGLIMLDALIRHQWGALWPQSRHARIDILSGLSQRLQQRIRMLSPGDNDLNLLYQVERQLASLMLVLQRLELKHSCRFDTLQALIHRHVTRLENRGDAPGADVFINPGTVLPPEAMITAERSSDIPLIGEDESDKTVPWRDASSSDRQPNLEVLTLAKKRSAFVAGMCLMLAINAAVIWSWSFLQRSDPLQTRLEASLSSLPVILTPAQREAILKQGPLPQAFIAETQQQITRLGQLPPDWNITYSRQLIEQAEALWPEQTKSMRIQWQQQLSASGSPKESLDGWYQGMGKLKQLSERLNGLDEQKGKYMTISELKSVVFSAIQSFNQTVPVEEQLRALALSSSGQTLPLAEMTQLEIHLKQLTTRYGEIKQNTAE
jgi:type VI secretion system protein VasL